MLVDYKKLYFSHPTLLKIHREPTYSSLNILKQELKANVSRVTSDLGGGVHRHLGLILTPAEYQLVLVDVYARPLHPGVLNIVSGVTHHETNRFTLHHTEEVHIFRETIDSKKS